MKISLITVAYINSKCMIDLLNSIAKYNDIGDDLEVIIVDNSPDDKKIKDAIKVADYQDYIYISENNRGFGAGNNAGAKIAHGEILAFINPDIIFVEPVFAKIYEKFTDPNLAIFGTQLLDANLQPMRSFGLHFQNRFEIFSEENLWYGNRFGFYNSDEFYIEGCDLIIRKNVFEEVGSFDENIFMYAEELDLYKRIKKVFPQMTIKFFPDIKMVHLIGQSSATDWVTLWTRVWNSEAYVCKKHNISFKKITEERYKNAQVRLQIAQALHYPLVEAICRNEIGICEYIMENFIKMRHID